MKHTLLTGALALGLFGSVAVRANSADEAPAVVRDDDVPAKKKKDEKAKTVSLYYLEASGKG
jgi:hypothetical protein